MKINDMRIGESIYFGSLIPPYYSARIDLVWKKVHENNTFILNQDSIAVPMDAKEPKSPSRQRRLRGCSFFPHTALFQWLNSFGEDWYKPSCDTDAPPNYSDAFGFLTGFSEIEIKSMVEQECRIVTPEGFKKDFGQEATVRCMVSIPSYSQLYHIRDDSAAAVFLKEGELLSCNTRELRPKYAWTRTGSNGYIYSTNDCDDIPEQTCPYEQRHVFPLIKLNPDMEVEGYNHFYTIKAPDGTTLSCVNDQELEKIWLE